MDAAARWRTGDAARAADVSHKRLMQLLDRGVFRLSPDDAETPGGWRLLSRASICRLAATLKLARAGLHMRLAAQLVDEFDAREHAQTHAPFLIADLANGPRLLIDEDATPTVNLVVDIAAIVADVEIRLKDLPPHD
ncbi:hypothetical protein AB4Z40_31985 [Bosea sp. 2YAB26]|uniref:hypothetical protein n=1 Tax=Bosea sp. 2YAB26 TaxID=3237478 RepID=UPI003F91DDAF